MRKVKANRDRRYRPTTYFIFNLISILWSSAGESEGRKMFHNQPRQKLKWKSLNLFDTCLTLIQDTASVCGKSISRQDMIFYNACTYIIWLLIMIRTWQEMWDGEVKGHHLYNIQKHVGNGRNIFGRRTQWYQGFVLVIKLFIIYFSRHWN